MATKRLSTQIEGCVGTDKDEDLEHRLVNFLYQRHISDKDSIHVVARGGTVVISGRLPSASAKRTCIECCRHVAGVRTLFENIEVPVDAAYASNESVSGWLRRPDVIS